MSQSIVFDDIVSFLSNPSNYPFPVTAIQKIETHISVVFLTGEFAYKLKKPVNFGFLDFSEKNQRLKFCQKELELNQRTAPQLYLEVVHLYQHHNRLSFQGDDSPIECLVKMRQFDNDKVLGSYLKHHTLLSSQVSDLAKQIANLHLKAEKISLEEEFGQPDVALQPMLDNFPSLKKFLTQHTSLNNHLPMLKEVAQTTLNQFEALKKTLLQRKQEGFIRKCHGDLHLDNIALVDDVPLLFDAIEFNDYFSQIDTISDLAFLLVDLEYRQQKPLALQVLSQYLHLTQDYQALELLNFYKVYRSMVRAKITALQAEQNQPNSQIFSELADKSTEYLKLAKQQQSQKPLPELMPKLILLQGVSGSGKSVFANQLLNLLDAIVISSDRTRKQLYGIADNHRVSEPERSQLYSKNLSEKTYRRMLLNAQATLKANFSVIVDATFLKHSHRATFFDMAKQLGIPAYLICLQIDQELATQSIQERLILDNDPSDADHTVMQQQLLVFEQPTEEEPALTLKVQDIRKKWPTLAIKKFLNLPLTSIE